MPALPPSSDFTGSAVTEGQFKTAISNLRTFLSDLLGSTGTVPAALSALGTLGGQTMAKTAAYTVIAADRGKLIECSGTFSLSLTAAATLGTGFSFIVANTGSGTITIDPNASETINGATTLSLAAGAWAIVVCNGTSFRATAAGVASGTLIGFQTFTASGTYSKGTNNPSFVIVEVVGGGGGAGYSLNSAGAGGGGGGGYARERISASLLAASETVTVGSGGTGGTSGSANGGTGGTSSFGTFCSATGGSGGIGNANTNGNAAGGAGGAGSGGNINLSGQKGGFGIGAVDGGAGGCSSFGAGGANSGSGGNGRTTAGTGLSGNSGIVIVWEYA